MHKIKKRYIKKFIERFNIYPSVTSFNLDFNTFGKFNEFKNREVLLEDIYLLDDSFNEREGLTLYEYDSTGILFLVKKNSNEETVFISFLYKTEKKNMVSFLISKIKNIKK